jgi:LmbE family N-acetylglucosaminyl deacetylase
VNVLVVAAHPDDEVLGPGGAILRHAASGDSVVIHIACGADNLRYDREQATRLYETARRVGARLGAAEVTLGELPDQRLDQISLPEIVSAVEGLIRRFDPEVVYTHHWTDLNRDHRFLSEAVAVAARPYTAPGIRVIRAFETPSSTEWGFSLANQPFVPNFFVDISSGLEEKLSAFSEYETEVRAAPHPRSATSLEARARYWGSVAGVEAAEAFVTARERW